MISEPWNEICGRRVRSAARRRAHRRPICVVEVDLAGIEGLVEVAMKPVDVGVRLVTVRPRVAMVLLVPVIVAAVTSVAVMVWLPGDFEVAVKMPTPLVKCGVARQLAAASLLVKWTVPV